MIEQLDDNRLIRPRADYIGPPYPNTEYHSTNDKASNGRNSCPPAVHLILIAS